jgi:predicted glycosyltransferase
MKIVFYCQYVFGMGHLFRSIELLRAFADADVTLVTGGREVAVRLPDHIRLVRMPPLYMDEGFTHLISGQPKRSVEQIQKKRVNLLFSLLDTERPELFITELYPFGRSFFEFELVPLLEAIRAGQFGPVRTVCSLRDVLVEKKEPKQFENRVLDRLDRFYDLLLIHSDRQVLSLDKTFGRTVDLPVQVHYTGFVASKTAPAAGRRLRTRLGIKGGDKMIVASAGGGRSGFSLLKNVIRACNILASKPVLYTFTGPFLDSEKFDQLQSMAAERIHVERLTDRFLDYLEAADLSISMAGYNTCMNLLATQVPALVYPYARQQEQPIRAEIVQNLAPVRVLGDGDIDPIRLSEHIDAMLSGGYSRSRASPNLMGAEDTRRFLLNWINSSAIEKAADQKGI